LLAPRALVHFAYRAWPERSLALKAVAESWARFAHRVLLVRSLALEAEVPEHLACP
jgi:hypothetical protein